MKVMRLNAVPTGGEYIPGAEIVAGNSTRGIASDARCRRQDVQRLYRLPRLRQRRMRLPDGVCESMSKVYGRRPHLGIPSITAASTGR
jgi:hypothetical protein